MPLKLKHIYKELFYEWQNRQKTFFDRFTKTFDKNVTISTKISTFY